MYRACSELPLVRDIFEKTFLKAFECLVKFFAAARKEGFLADWVNPLLSASNFYGVILHVGKNQDIAEQYYKITITDPKHSADIRDYLLKTALDGITKK